MTTTTEELAFKACTVCGFPVATDGPDRCAFCAGMIYTIATAFDEEEDAVAKAFEKKGAELAARDAVTGLRHEQGG